MELLPQCLAGIRLVGWTLVHFLWQGALVGLLYALARTILPRGEARYRAGMAALLAMALCPLATAWHLRGAIDGAADAPLLPVFAAGAGAPDGGALAAGGGWLRGLDIALPWLVLAWSLGVLLLSCRAWRQWRRLRCVVRAAGALPAWQRRAAGLASRFGLRRPVQVLRSAVVAAPVLVGWLRPAILLPVAVVAEFPAAQIEWILAHELAHLRRWDPLANLFQVTLETLHFHHPAVRWVSRDVRNERELCCDALAVSRMQGDPREFAVALAGLGEMRAERDALLLSAGGGVLLERVRRLAAPHEQFAAETRAPARFVAAWLGALLLAACWQSAWRQADMRTALAGAAETWSSELALPWRAVAWQMPGLVPAHLHAVLPARVEAVLPAIAPAVAPLLQGAWTAPGLHLANPGNLVRMDALRPVETALPIPAANAPRAIRMREPVYPPEALERGVAGRVVIEFSLAPDGGVRNMRVVDASPAGVFDRAAVQALDGWRYAVPIGAAAGRRYRQAMVFDPPSDAANASGDWVATNRTCRVVTGSHICRRYVDTTEAGARTATAGK